MMFPQPWITDDHGERARLDDLLPSGFVLVTRRTPPAAARAELDAAGITRHVLDGEGSAIDRLATRDRNGLIDAWMTKLGLASIIVRPNHVVFAGSGEASSEIRLATQLHEALNKPDQASW